VVLALSAFFNPTLLSVAQSLYNQAYTFTTFAGYPSEGSADGVGSEAQFFQPVGICFDGSSNIYVADTENSAIREITPAGVVRTIAGAAGITGSTDGTGSNARFGDPQGICIDSSGNLYVADTDNQAIRKLAPVGTNWVVSTVAHGARLFGIAVDSTGNLYFTDSDTIWKITSVGSNWLRSTIAGGSGTTGSTDGLGVNAQFDYPYGIAVDRGDNLYVADSSNNTIRKITPEGTNWVVTTLAGSPGNSGSADGTGTNALFDFPTSICSDNSDNLYVGDSYNGTIREITSTGLVSTIAGLAQNFGSANGTGTNARFAQPWGIAVGNSDNLYVADAGNSVIRTITSARVVNTLAGSTGSSRSADGTGSNARFDTPEGITVDSAGNLYVADTHNNTIRTITPAGLVNTIAGVAGNYGSADGTGSNARFGVLGGIAVDSADNLYVVDVGNDTIRQVTPVGTNWIVSTLAGSPGSSGSADGLGTNALFDFNFNFDWAPAGIAVDSVGNLYVADTLNGTIRKITLEGTNWMVTTLAGSPRSYGFADGTGTNALFWYPTGIAVDSAGNLYVADTVNETIRKGAFTAYGINNPVAYTPPGTSGSLQVSLLPASANGQWQFPWDQFWRNSGDVVSNLVPGNYPIVFADVPNYLPYPSITVAAVTNNGTCYVTNQYLSTSGSGPSGIGSLTVQFYPNSPPSEGGWQFIGGTSWNPAVTTNIQSGVYYIQFEPVSGWSTPASQAVQISSGQNTIVTVNYLLAQSVPSGMLLPQLVPTGSINDMTDYGFAFNGQLVTDVGYGSGVAVQANVVLTAAHLLFNDYTLSYANQTYWYFEEEAGVSQPQPMAARGWYMLSDYASQRTNDLLGGYSPDQSSPQSRNDDAAAVYFLSPCAGGAYAGYLPSDASPNTWLTSTALKMLTGYPVDGSDLGQVLASGQMYYTQPEPYPLNQATDPVVDQQVYVAPWFLSFPGNSGGPFYVQLNGSYYSAGIYLGTAYNGVVPYASYVRAIDSTVVNLITNAATYGDSGTNNASGGVITLIARLATTNNPALLSVTLGPPAVVQAGAYWQLQRDTNDYASDDIAPVTTTNGALVFSSVSGWKSPTSPPVQLTANTFNTITNLYYTVIPPTMSLNSARGIGIIGTTNTTYLIQYRTNLTAGQWQTLSTNTLGPITHPPPIIGPCGCLNQLSQEAC
jgi:sugar lactone lactonase YvrE